MSWFNENLSTHILKSERTERKKTWSWLPKRVLPCTYQQYSWKVTGGLDSNVPAGYLSEF